MKKASLLCLIFGLIVLLSACNKDQDVDLKHIVKVNVNGVEMSLIRDVEIIYINNKLTVQGKDWVDNYLEFTAEEVKSTGYFVIDNGTFVFADNPSMEYSADLQDGVLNVVELTETKLVGTFGMNLNAPSGEFAELTNGSLDLSL